ncbi:TraB/GumN family protein [Kordiimonas aestuarii]|uniref:TraB/GumN family protein n=1 Tax=Kordiimonas aestuarii TaxID=1005925 RepID=UPI0021D3DE95|nr:TraB/GumN family protein [Kordiimonas aestuarii]
MKQIFVHMHSIKHLPLQVFLALCLVFTGHAAGAAPALWRLADADTEIHIFGTLHVLAKDINWLTTETKTAFEGASALIVELNGDEIDRAGPLFTDAGRLPEGQSLRALVGNGIYNDVQRLARQLGMPVDTFANSEPWFAGMSLSVIGLVKAGYDPASGTDKYFIAQAETMGKPIFGLETAAQQVALFESLNTQQEKALLIDTLKQNAAIDVHFAAMQAAWLSGNVAELDHILNDALSIAPGLEEQLLTARNRDWADKLMQVLERPGRYFVAVGAGHLTDEESLIEMLRAMGLTVNRVQ